MADDPKLAANLKQARSGTMCFAVVAKGANDGVLLVAKSAVPAKDIAEAKTRCGGSEVFRGTCHTEDDTTIFELPKEPPATLAKLIKTLATRDAGVNLKVETRLAGGAPQDGEAGTPESESSEAPPDAAKPPAPNALGPANAALQKLIPAVNAAVAANPDRKDDLLRPLARAQQAIKEGRAPEAQAALVETGKALAALSAAPTSPAAEDSASVWKERVTELQTELKRVLSTRPPDAAKIIGRFNEALALAKAGDYSKGHAVLDEVDDLLVAATRAARQADTGQAVPKGTVALGATRVRWLQVKGQALQGAQQLADALQGDDDADARECVKIIRAITVEFPAEVENSLAQLEKAVQSSDAAQVATLKTRTIQQLKECLAFMGAKKFYLDLCENNPYDVAVSIQKPLLDALREMSGQLAKL